MVWQASPAHLPCSTNKIWAVTLLRSTRDVIWVLREGTDRVILSCMGLVLVTMNNGYCCSHSRLIAATTWNFLCSTAFRINFQAGYDIAVLIIELSYGPKIVHLNYAFLLFWILFCDFSYKTKYSFNWTAKLSNLFLWYLCSILFKAVFPMTI